MQQAPIQQQIPIQQQVPMQQQQVPMQQQMHPGQVPMQQIHPGQVPMMPIHPGQGQMPPQIHPGQPPIHVAQPPMTMPLFDENADDAPAVAMEYKVHVDPGREECYYQFVQKGATIYVSFQVSTFL